MNIIKRAMLRLRPVRRGQSESDWRSARDWWKAPVLQGPENDYGEYDYLAEPLPENTGGWIHDICRCDYCGKYRRHARRYDSYFYTCDGYDYMSDTECWRCCLKDWASRKRRAIKTKLKYTKEV